MLGHRIVYYYNYMACAPRRLRALTRIESSEVGSQSAVTKTDYSATKIQSNHMTLAGVLEFLSFYANSRKSFYWARNYIWLVILIL